MTQNKYVIPVLIVALIGAMFMLGRLSAQVEYMAKGGSNNSETVTGAATPTAEPESPLSVANLKAYAKDIGLDENKFNSCLDEGKMTQRVTDDTNYSASLGVSGTPHFIINGINVVGALPLDAFTQVIDAELKNGSGLKVAVDNKFTDIETKTEVKKGANLRGKEGAKIRMVEFSDFECPYCARAYPTVKALEEKYKDQISMEYRHYPLSFHPNAQKAAEAAECAAEQGKFWEMHDKMFTVSAVAQG